MHLNIWQNGEILQFSLFHLKSITQEKMVCLQFLRISLSDYECHSSNCKVFDETTMECLHLAAAEYSQNE